MLSGEEFAALPDKGWRLPREEWREASFGGNDCATREDELAFFERHGVPIKKLTHVVVIRPGETLVIERAIENSRRTGWERLRAGLTSR